MLNDVDPSLHFAVGCPGCAGAPDELGFDAGAAAGAERPCVLGGGAVPAGGAASPGSPDATPPWCEQAPLPPFDSDPSLHFTIGVDAGGVDVGAGLAAGAVLGAALGAGAVAAPAATPP